MTGEPVGAGPLGGRRQARERALSLLYEADAKSCKPAAVVGRVCDHQGERADYLRRFARDWSLERMPTVDRTLLRMGVYELLYRPDVPTGAVISEAVEVAQPHPPPESGRFVNGMLGRIAEEVRGEAEAPR